MLRSIVLFIVIIFLSNFTQYYSFIWIFKQTIVNNVLSSDFINKYETQTPS